MRHFCPFLFYLVEVLRNFIEHRSPGLGIYGDSCWNVERPITRIWI